jgi:hypothetical protein
VVNYAREGKWALVIAGRELRMPLIGLAVEKSVVIVVAEILMRRQAKLW